MGGAWEGVRLGSRYPGPGVVVCHQAHPAILIYYISVSSVPPVLGPEAANPSDLGAGHLGLGQCQGTGWTFLRTVCLTSQGL